MSINFEVAYIDFDQRGNQLTEWITGSLRKVLTMEEKERYNPFGLPEGWVTVPGHIASIGEGWSDTAKEQHTFLVTLPDNDRREVKAAYMEVDGGSLYFEDDSQETILAFGPGHWVWAERVEGE